MAALLFLVPVSALFLSNGLFMMCSPQGWLEKLSRFHRWFSGGEVWFEMIPEEAVRTRSQRLGYRIVGAFSLWIGLEVAWIVAQSVMGVRFTPQRQTYWDRSMPPDVFVTYAIGLILVAWPKIVFNTRLFRVPPPLWIARGIGVEVVILSMIDWFSRKW